MLAASKLVGFLHTTDYERARAFYEGKLGFQFVSLDQFALALRSGDNMIRITKEEKLPTRPGNRSRLGSRRRPRHSPVAQESRCRDREVQLRPRPGARHLGLALRRSGRLVQRPRRKRSLPKPPRLTRLRHDLSSWDAQLRSTSLHMDTRHGAGLRIARPSRPRPANTRPNHRTRRPRHPKQATPLLHNSNAPKNFSSRHRVHAGHDHAPCSRPSR